MNDWVADSERLRSPQPCNAMSIDVEDYFQVHAFSGVVERDAWDGLEARVERNTYRALEVFGEAGVKATFFTLGWVAERYPGLIRDVVAQGHELASHGYSHVKANTQDPGAFRQDVAQTRKILEDIGGVQVLGYRAASYSIDNSNLWAFDELAEAGYEYSSSVYPIRHDHYGMPDAPRFAFRPSPSGILEVPVTTVQWAGRNWPCGGGGYFRLLPYRIYRWGLERVNREDAQPGVFYFHPWELDPGQPRLPGISAKARFRHFLNLERMQGRLERLLRDFPWKRMDEVFLNTGVNA